MPDSKEKEVAALEQTHDRPSNEKFSRSKATIVIAVNSGYYAALKNLIGSLHYWEPDRKIVVYNLGLNKQSLDELSNICGVTVHWPAGIPSYLPEHTRVMKVYAWKPFVIKDAVDRYEKIFYMDGGSDVRAPLTRVDSDIEQDGFFYVRDGGVNVADLAHVGIFQYLNLSKSDFKEKKVFYGTYQGYIKGGFAYFHILDPMIRCAENANCISPPGSNLGNHRYDQTALSIFVHLSGVKITHTHNDFQSWQRTIFEQIPTNPSKRSIYTARSRSHEYEGYIKTKSRYLDCNGDGSQGCGC